MITLAVLAAASLVGAPAPTASPQSEPNCPGESTIEINDCLGGRLSKADAELDRYLAAARKRLQSDAAGDAGAGRALAELDTAQAAWRAYRGADCDAVYDYWSGGTIRNAMSLTCQIDLTRARTHTVWSEWLTYMDSTPPILPEPSTASGAPFAN